MFVHVILYFIHVIVFLSLGTSRHMYTYVEKISRPSFYSQTRYNYCSFSFLFVHIICFIIRSRFSLFSPSFSVSGHRCSIESIMRTGQPLIIIFQMKEEEEERRLRHCRPCAYALMNSNKF